MRRFVPGMLALGFVLAACTAELPVDPTVTDVVVSPAESELAVGATRRLEADVRGPGRPSQAVTWSTNNQSVARVGETGLVEGVAPGRAIITAISTFDPTKSGTATITVIPAAPPPPDSWSNAAQVTAVADANTPVRSGESVSRASPDYYQVRLPASLNQPLVYVELANVTGGEAVVEVFSAATPRESVYASRSPAWFGRSSNVLSLSEDELETLKLDSLQIMVDVACRGPCIIVERPRAGQEVSIFVRVSTSGTATVRYNLHVYDDDPQDLGEPENSLCQGFPSALGAGTPVFAAAGPTPAPGPAAIIVEPVPDQRFRAALETVGDRDCYRVEVPVNRVSLTRASDNLAINIRARIYDLNSGQELWTLLVERGQQEDVSPPLGNRPVRIVVDSSNERAGPSATSSYELDFPTN